LYRSNILNLKHLKQREKERKGERKNKREREKEKERERENNIKSTTTKDTLVTTDWSLDSNASFRLGSSKAN
jgi:hypothetical protein